MSKRREVRLRGDGPNFTAGIRPNVVRLPEVAMPYPVSPIRSWWLLLRGPLAFLLLGVAIGMLLRGAL